LVWYFRQNSQKIIARSSVLSQRLLCLSAMTRRNLTLGERLRRVGLVAVAA
jgi:hypothetical protein